MQKARKIRVYTARQIEPREERRPPKLIDGLPACLAKYRHLIKSVSDERDGPNDDGYWVYLKDGYSWDGCSAVHEASPTACAREMSSVEAIEPS